MILNDINNVDKNVLNMFHFSSLVGFRIIGAKFFTPSQHTKYSNIRKNISHFIIKLSIYSQQNEDSKTILTHSYVNF